MGSKFFEREKQCCVPLLVLRVALPLQLLDSEFSSTCAGTIVMNITIRYVHVGIRTITKCHRTKCHNIFVAQTICFNHYSILRFDNDNVYSVESLS